uniref:Uncharacterized protein n=1 Tax=Nelumbo nucifera TaxID=4432 RepID=A0A822YDY6_NELNU|nr:TPA_asm: hypothetical protein HUJ06_009621 [Nelumbo nucifera]
MLLQGLSVRRNLNSESGEKGLLSFFTRLWIIE